MANRDGCVTSRLYVHGHQLLVKLKSALLNSCQVLIMAFVSVVNKKRNKVSNADDMIFPEIPLLLLLPLCHER